ncbi:MAG TPA: translation initiation factor IF-2 N-terminal domain-containing protein, partial [Usitatibacteraceae bacterium]|nr:translation initiation factor IF-2 N-terminal domain-containing protein [Usitatibacteraceae bacterium]
MAQMTVAQFAEQLKLTEEVLLEQLKAAGVKKKTAGEKLTEDDKSQLLAYLQEAHGHKEEKKKITLVRKQTSEIKKSDSMGKARTIQVEVRKKRTFVKVDKATEAVETVKPAEPSQPIIDEGELAKRKAEEDRQAALLAKQAEEKAKAATARQKTKKDEEGAAAPAADASGEVKAEPPKRTVRKKAAEPVAAAPGDVPPAGEAAENRPRIGERVVLKKDPPASEGTLHRPVLKPGEAKTTDKKGAKKTARPATASSWADEMARRRAIKTRGDTSGGRDGWRGRRSKDRHADDDSTSNFQAPTEPIIREVMVPETITVGELAQKMAVKAAEVIKTMMKMGSMVTINQVLDQDTAMILVQEMGHTAKAAKADDPEAYLA